jgi:hypothetical protein
MLKIYQPMRSPFLPSLLGSDHQPECWVSSLTRCFFCNRDKPLSLSASLVFEQSYGGVEGDSASSAELYVILSALAQVPIKQSIAVTGSVNQHAKFNPSAV